MENTILKENKKKESKPAAYNIEIELAIDSLKENGDVDETAELENGIDDPGVEATKLVKDSTPPPAKSHDLEGFGTRFDNLSKDVDDNVVQPEENASEAAGDISNEATFRNVPFPFDPGILMDLAEDSYYNEDEAEAENENGVY